MRDRWKKDGRKKRQIEGVNMNEKRREGGEKRWTGRKKDRVTKKKEIEIKVQIDRQAT